MTEDWAAVAKAINQRANELGLRQRDLAQRSHVSQAIIREIQRHTVERRRSARTLEALSLALEWHPNHLAAVLRGRTPPNPGDEDEAGELVTRLSAIEDRLDDIVERLDAIQADLTRRGVR
ncbi:XRE family transcriptional regulator [Prauserella oleivorans]|uniref:XRE family transcriptional regulator n=1 Tax=Prauserella oleivorans TaxID=1478153 RepID=A0ABW5W7X5_9PSEU